MVTRYIKQTFHTIPIGKLIRQMQRENHPPEAKRHGCKWPYGNLKSIESYKRTRKKPNALNYVKNKRK